MMSARAAFCSRAFFFVSHIVEAVPKPASVSVLKWSQILRWSLMNERNTPMQNGFLYLWTHRFDICISGHF